MMTLGTHLYLPKGYACAKFGCYSSINVTMTPSMFVRQLATSKVLHMHVSTQVLFRYENVPSVFI